MNIQDPPMADEKSTLQQGLYYLMFLIPLSLSPEPECRFVAFLISVI